LIRKQFQHEKFNYVSREGNELIKVL
jgi:hypothetical protein